MKEVKENGKGVYALKILNLNNECVFEGTFELSDDQAEDVFNRISNLESNDNEKIKTIIIGPGVIVVNIDIVECIYFGKQ